MRKIYLIAGLSFLAVNTMFGQQSLNVVKGSVTYNFPAETAGIMTYSGGKTVTIQGAEFSLQDVNIMKVENSQVKENTVTVVYSGEYATVVVAGNIAKYIKATVDGAHVVIDQDDEVSDKTCGEITYGLSGNSSNGSFCLNGSFKATIELSGLSLTNPNGGAIDIQNGKRIELSAKNGTENTLVDGASGDQKSALYCKGHLELKGKGTLNVTGNKSHAISAKEYVEMKNLTLNILGSKKDGINCAQYFLIESGNLTITNPGDDGIQVAYKDATNRETEDTGSITISGGEINISAITASAAKALKAEGDFIMTDGKLTASTTAPGEWDSAKLKTKASSCISADCDVTISGGTLNLSASGGGGKGISCDGVFTFNEGGDLTIVTSGGVLAYVNNSLNQNYTGNTDNLKSDYKSSPKGVKADDGVVINGGKINIKTSGNGGEGIESKKELTINEGTIKVRAKDDAINSSNHMYIKGGTIDVISTSNDGLDSNGDLYISGGVVMAFGGSSPECGLDANEEEGYTVYFTGGYILAAGGGNSVPTKTGSTQPYVKVSAAVSANSEVSIGTSTSTIYTFTTPEDLTNVSLGGGGGGRPGGSNSGNSLVISVPGLTTGTSYTVKSGTTTTTGSAVLTGSSGGRW